jgi:hypothetical protein
MRGSARRRSANRRASRQTANGSETYQGHVRGSAKPPKPGSDGSIGPVHQIGPSRQEPKAAGREPLGRCVESIEPAPCDSHAEKAKGDDSTRQQSVRSFHGQSLSCDVINPAD